MSDPSYILKLQRAREHLDAIKAEARTWIESKPCTAFDEPDPEPPLQSLPDGYVARQVRIHKVARTTSRLSILIGDCVFNLRSALDHLALALANQFTPNLTSRGIERSEFPIFHDAVTYQQDSPRRIGFVAPVAQAAIELLQPYHRGNTFYEHPLWQIHELSRIDKHRRLIIGAGFPSEDFTWTLKRVNVAAMAYFAPQEDIPLDYRLDVFDAIVVKWAGLPQNANNEMRMDLTLPIAVCIGEGKLAGAEVIPTLKALCDFVGDSVISPLSKFL